MEALFFKEILPGLEPFLKWNLEHLQDVLVFFLVAKGVDVFFHPCFFSSLLISPMIVFGRTLRRRWNRCRPLSFMTWDLKG